MSNVRPSTRTGAVLAALLAALALPLLAACSGGGSGSPASSEGSGSPAAAAEATLASTTLQGRTNALNHLRIAACPSGDGELEAAGTVRNRGDQAADYVVTVTWLDAAGSALETVETTVEDVEPATNARWRASATLDEPAGSCTTTLARGTLP